MLLAHATELVRVVRQPMLVGRVFVSLVGDRTVEAQGFEFRLGEEHIWMPCPSRPGLHRVSLQQMGNLPVFVTRVAHGPELLLEGSCAGFELEVRNGGVHMPLAITLKACPWSEVSKPCG